MKILCFFARKEIFCYTVRWRAFNKEDLSLQSPVGGTPILKEGLVLMEVKCAGGMPVWMAKILSEEHIYKTSFSKYGTAYETLIFPRIKGETTYV